MMKYIVTMLGVALISSSVMADAVTNTVKWNVPWGDAFRSAAQVTLDAYETVINAQAAGSAAGATALQPGIMVVGVSTSSLVSTVTITDTLAAPSSITGWWSATAAGASDTNRLASVAAGANTTLLSDSDSAVVVYTSHTTGTGVLTITTDAASTNYFNVVQRDGAIKSSPAIITSE